MEVEAEASASKKDAGPEEPATEKEPAEAQEVVPSQILTTTLPKEEEQEPATQGAVPVAAAPEAGTGPS
eukprot:10065641-Lingulodinium_polyedra.AAC.1